MKAPRPAALYPGSRCGARPWRTLRAILSISALVWAVAACAPRVPIPVELVPESLAEFCTDLGEVVGRADGPYDPFTPINPAALRSAKYWAAAAGGNAMLIVAVRQRPSAYGYQRFVRARALRCPEP